MSLSDHRRRAPPNRTGSPAAAGNTRRPHSAIRGERTLRSCKVSPRPNRDWPATESRDHSWKAIGSTHYLRGSAQTRDQKLAVLGVPQDAGVGYHDRGDGPQSRDNLSGVVEPAQMRVAGGKNAI